MKLNESGENEIRAMAAVARSFVKMIRNDRNQFAIIFVRKRRRRRRRSGVGGSNTKEYQSAWEKDFQEGDDIQAGGRVDGGRAGQTRINQPLRPPSLPPIRVSDHSEPQRKKVCGPTDAKPLRRIYGRRARTPAPARTSPSSL